MYERKVSKWRLREYLNPLYDWPGNNKIKCSAWSDEWIDGWAYQYLTFKDDTCADCHDDYNNDDEDEDDDDNNNKNKNNSDDDYNDGDDYDDYNGSVVKSQDNFDHYYKRGIFFNVSIRLCQL